MERLYRGFLVLILVIAVGWGVWYCMSTYNQEHSTKDATLVWNERGDWNAAGNGIY